MDVLASGGRSERHSVMAGINLSLSLESPDQPNQPWVPPGQVTVEELPQGSPFSLLSHCFFKDMSRGLNVMITVAILVLPNHYLQCDTNNSVHMSECSFDRYTQTR